ncbi:MAG: DUF5057 domain-containing protein, partial [Lachnospiraceae bacterium]|nr:DUF5057 domain-containing protein [Lachnospiraceae bacterium]
MKNSGKRKAYYRSVLAMAMVFVTMSSVFTFGVTEVEAANPTLRKIASIADQGDTFSILEIVPETSATVYYEGEDLRVPAGGIGYLIGGQEPFEKTEDIGTRRRVLSYLKDSGSLEGITGTGSGNVLAVDDGAYQEYLEDMDMPEASRAKKIASIKETDVVSLDGIAMKHKVSGNYVKLYYELSGNERVFDKARKYINGKEDSGFVSSNEGDFQPALKKAEGGAYHAAFAAVSPDQVSSNKYGYFIEGAPEEIESGGSWTAGLTEGDYVYKKNGEVYECWGTLSKNGDKISVNALNAVTVNEKGGQETPDEAPAGSGPAEEAPGGPEEPETPGEPEPPAEQPEIPETPAEPVAPEEPAAPVEAVDPLTLEVTEVALPERFSSPDEEGLVAGELTEESPLSEDTPEQPQAEPEPAEAPAGEPEPVAEEETPVPEEVVSDNILPRDEEAEIVPEEALPGGEIPEEGAEEVKEGGSLADSDKLYIPEFKYKDDNNDKDAVSYHITKWSPSANGAWSVDDTKVLVPDLTGEGVIAETGGIAAYIVYKFDKGNGVFVPGLEGGAHINEMGAGVFWGGLWTNNEFFRRFVFDRTETAEIAGLDIKVTTVSASTLKPDSFGQYDLIFIAASGTGFIKDAPSANYSGKNDISGNAAKEILRLASLEATPILAEHSVADGSESVMKRLVNSLAFKDYTLAYNAFDESAVSAAVAAENPVISGNSFLNDRVYMFDDSGERGVVNGDFNADLSAGESFDTVKRYIDYENRFYDKNVEEKLSEATVIRHIIAYEEMMVKGVYRVLEIEPQDMSGDMKGENKTYKQMASSNQLSYDLRTDDPNEHNGITTLYYMDHSVSPDFVNLTVSDPDPVLEEKPLFSTKGEIILTQMSVQEFIGNIDDLNSEYDLIFIGADTSGMNTGFYGTNNSKYGPVYNDKTMNGMIFTNIGDTFKLDNHLSPGFPEYSGDRRFSGTDILKADITRLKDFADARLPVIISDKLLNPSKNGVSKNGVLDHHSNMYKAIKTLYDSKDRRKCLFAVSDVVSDNSGLYSYMEEARPEIGLKNDAMYEGVVDAENLGDGKCQLKIEFRIKDAYGSKNKKYDARLYLDRNADGKFSEQERDTSAVTWLDGDTDLEANKDYTLTRVFSASQNRVVPWRLVVYQNGNDTVKKRRGSVKGYTRITGEKPTIKVLQLMSTKWKNETPNLVNLQKVMEGNTILGRYLRDVNGNMAFSLDIKSVQSEDFIETLVPGKTVEDYRKYLENFDLVICGFADCWSFGRVNGDEETLRLNSLAAQGLTEYISEGRAILFSHDCTSYWSRTDDSWSYGIEINKYVRDAVGMNRYGFAPTAYGTSEPIKLRFRDEQYDKILKPNATGSGEETY